MKIRILGPAHPYRGGIAKFNEVLAASFGREGHDVKIVSFTLQYPAFLFPGRTQYTRMAAPEGAVITATRCGCSGMGRLRSRLK